MGLIIDCFAGGGGTSTGIEMATGRDVDIAINHDPDAITMHEANHPNTKHYCENVWEVDPLEATQGKHVTLAWFSPDCTHFSRAKGGTPVKKNIRGLAWVILRWAALTKPDVIMVENVPEFLTWGPIKNGKPIKSKKGQTFQQWKSQLEALGYVVKHQELKACDYGAPTARKRLSIIMRRDGRPIVFPDGDYAPAGTLEVVAGLKKPYRTAAEIIDWDIPCLSIFERKKPLAENTMRRIARGLKKFVIDNPEPFIVTVNHAGDMFRGQSIEEPLHTVTAVDHNALVTSHLCILRNHEYGQDMREPLKTICTSPGHFAEVRAFLIKYYGQGVGQKVDEPLDTVVSKDRFGLVTVKGTDYMIIDIGMRMLTPRELFNAQGFPPDYKIDISVNGKPYSKAKQVARCGNAVPPPFAEALVRANLPELCSRERKEAI